MTLRPRGGRAADEEVELKLVVLDPVAIRALVLDPAAWIAGAIPRGPARTVEVEDRYLDTSGGALRSVGLVARVRTVTGVRRLHLKSLARRGSGAVHRRLELEGSAGEDDDPRGWPPSTARDRLLGEIGAHPLVTLATLYQRRFQRDVTVGTSVIELSLDEVEVSGHHGNQRAVWTELECELRTGGEADLEALGEALASRRDLEPATTSKLERALDVTRDPFTDR